MPAKPSWAWRLPDALAALRACSDEWVDRRAVEELFGCSKTVAWRILKQCGVESGPGGALACRRAEFVERLETVASGGGVVEREIARRERLGEMLDRIRPTVIANLKSVARDKSAEALINARFDRLPTGINLSPRELRISFSGMDDFLQKFGVIVFALNNDFQALQGFIDASRTPPISD